MIHTEHVVTIRAEPHIGTIPFIFEARCSCGWSTPLNAFKWAALDVQEHLTAVGLATHRGRIRAANSALDRRTHETQSPM